MTTYSVIQLILFLILGLYVGNFLSILIHRMPRENVKITLKSYCETCGSLLSWRETIPIIGYLINLGRCRYCKEKISVKYPLIEILTSAVFGFTYIIGKANNISNWLLPLILIIATLVIMGIFTDFLYHGVFNFSTIWLFAFVVILYFIKGDSIVSIFTKSLESIVYFSPMIFIAIFCYFRDKGKYVVALSSFIIFAIMIVIFMMFVPFNFYIMKSLFLTLIYWLLLYLIVELIRFIFKKVFNLKNIDTAANYIEYISLLLLLLNYNADLKTLFNSIISINLKNVIVLVVGTLLFIFMIEIFNSHDNNEDVLSNDEEIIERDENTLTEYIGDGDILALPFIGFILGLQNVLSFYVIVGFVSFAIYMLIFKKGSSYCIPLYPYLALALILLI